jgi:hypothetical protein
LGNVDIQKPFFEDFETGAKGSYATAMVQCSAATWQLTDALLGKDVNSNIATSLRLKGSGVAEMQTDKIGGCDSLWFYAGNYNNDTGATLTVNYSLDGGQTWTEVVTLQSFDGWRRYGFAIEQPGNIRLQFRGGGVASKRVNVDDIQMSDYNEETSISEELRVKSEESDGAWYALDGRKLSRKPTQPGIYIKNGRKELVR